MRIACLQFAPQAGDIDNNLNRADAVLNRANQDDLDDLDVLVLPELAFTGEFVQPSQMHVSLRRVMTIAPIVRPRTDKDTFLKTVPRHVPSAGILLTEPHHRLQFQVVTTYLSLPRTDR
jgi:hypothetical protein